MQTKICYQCKSEKTFANFYKDKTKTDGLSPRCIDCDKKKATNFRQNNKEKVSETHKKYYIKNKDTILATIKTKRLQLRNGELKRDYGITLEDYNNMFEEQNGVCAICGKPETSKYTNLQVDHNHVTGKIRELLCGKCNRMLGHVNDNIDILKSAIEYLEKHIRG